MRKFCTAVALSAALLIPSAISAADHNKRVVVYFDRDNRDRHEWNEREERAYRHWLEHRGSEGLVAEILQPVEEVVVEPVQAEEEAAHAAHMQHEHEDKHFHPRTETTADEMARVRPDLTTGELKMPKLD